MPSLLPVSTQAGREVFFVAREQGMLRALPGLTEIKAMPSFVQCEIAAKPRDFVYRQVNFVIRLQHKLVALLGLTDMYQRVNFADGVQH